MWLAFHSDQAKPGSSSPVELESTIPFGKKQKDPTHSANFGLKLKERLDELGVPCELVYKGASSVKHKHISQYLISKLK